MDEMRWPSQLEKGMGKLLEHCCMSAVTLDVSPVCAQSWTTLSNRTEAAEENLHTPMAPLLGSLEAQLASCTQSIHCIATHKPESEGIHRTGLIAYPVVWMCQASTNHTLTFGCEKAYEVFGRSESTLEKEEEEQISETNFKKGRPVMMYKSAFRLGTFILQNKSFLC